MQTYGLWKGFQTCDFHFRHQGLFVASCSQGVEAGMEFLSGLQCNQSLVLEQGQVRLSGFYRRPLTFNQGRLGNGARKLRIFLCLCTVQVWRLPLSIVVHSSPLQLAARIWGLATVAPEAEALLG